MMRVDGLTMILIPRICLKEFSGLIVVPLLVFSFLEPNIFVSICCFIMSSKTKQLSQRRRILEYEGLIIICAPI
jgi:hypothetical protein